MKRLILLLLLIGCCTSCTALPAEERAFAVVLCVEKDGEAWRVHGRIPTYQSGGGYLTVTGEGDALPVALADMEASAPMHVNLSQLRLLVLHQNVVDAGEITFVLTTLSERPDMRQHCALALTDTTADKLMEAIQPATGARLSKSIDVLLESRIEQGTVLPAMLADVIRMGERQTPMLIALTLKDKKIELSGGYPLTDQLRTAGKLSPEETALLSMLMGHAKSMRLTLSDGSAEIRDVSAKISLAEDLQTASVRLTLRTTTSSFTPDGLEQRLAEECLHLLTRLSADGCDVLGLGRKAILRAHDFAAWHALDWPVKYRQLRWSVSVRVNGPA